MRFAQQTLATTALALLGVSLSALGVSALGVSAAELSDTLAPAIAKHYQAFADRRDQLKGATAPADRLEYAKLLANTQPAAADDPLPKPDLDAANKIIDQLVATGTPAVKQQALDVRAEILSRSDQVADNFAARTIERDLAAQGYMPALAQAIIGGQGLPTGVTQDVAVDILEGGVLGGDSDAALALSKLLATSDPARSKVLAQQSLVFLAANAGTSITAATELGRRYLLGDGLPQNLDRAMELFNVAVATGANGPLTILSGALTQHVPGLTPDMVKPLIFKGLAAGSSKAAELVVDDVMGRPLYGFTANDAHYVVSLVAKIGDRPSLLLAAKAYANGLGGAPDVAHAVPYVEQLAKVDGLAPAAILDVAESLDTLLLPDSLAVKYVEPLYRQVAAAGGANGDEAEYRADRLLAEATHSGALPLTALTPGRTGQMIAALKAAGGRGHARSLILLGDLYFLGTWVPLNARQAIQYYDQSLTLAANAVVEERLAKALLLVRNSPFDDQRYHDLIAQLASEGSPWGLYRKGVDLITANTDVAGGENLLLQLSAKAYIPAIKAMLKHLQGSPNDKRIDQAVTAFSTAWSTRKDIRIGRELGDLYAFAGRNAQARAVYEDPIFAGDPDATLALAKLYATAQPPDEGKAMALAHQGLQLAADDQATQLGFIHVMLGLNLPEAKTESNAALLKLADASNADAITLLMPSYIDRVASDPEALVTVAKWSDVLARTDTEDPILKLATRYLGRDADPKTALPVLQIATRALSVLPPQTYLGVIVADALYGGYGMPADVPRANGLIEKAAAAGNKDALAELGTQYFYGMGRDRNPDTALQLLDSAASLGSNVARVTLGRLYSSATGPDVDTSEAFSMFRSAADNGSTAGMLEVGRLYLAGWGVGKDEAAGVALLEKAAGLGNTDAMYQLYFHFLAKGDPDDVATANVWLKKSADNGVDPARLRLAQQMIAADPVGNRAAAIKLLDQAFANGYNLARKYKQRSVLTLPTAGAPAGTTTAPAVAPAATAPSASAAPIVLPAVTQISEEGTP